MIGDSVIQWASEGKKCVWDDGEKLGKIFVTLPGLVTVRHLVF